MNKTFIALNNFFVLAYSVEPSDNEKRRLAKKHGEFDNFVQTCYKPLFIKKEERLVGEKIDNNEVLLFKPIDHGATASFVVSSNLVW